MAQLRQGESGEASDQFTYALLGPSTGDIAQLVERRPCEWVVALTGWVPNCLGGNASIFHLNWWLTLPKNGGGGPKHATERLYWDKYELSCRAG